MKELEFENKPLEVKINGEVYTVDADNIEVVEAFTEFAAKLENAAARLGRDKNNPAGAVRELCEDCITAADRMLGAGAAKKIFGKTISFVKCCRFARFLSDAMTEYYTELTKELKK